MKKILPVVILVQFGVLFSHAQVYNGDLVFSNQADIDNFSNAPYTSVNGKLEVRDDLDGVHDIRNLAGLAGLTSVTGFVAIRFNNVLPNTAFLNLQSIGTGMSISSNPGLTTINGMGSLVSVAGQIDIQNNEFLTTVSAFGNLPAVGGLVIQQNTRLTNLGGFSNLSVITGSLIIGDNISLTGLSGFANLTNVTLSMIIRNNPSIGSISGLANLRRVGTLNIQNNISLVNLDGANSLQTILNGFDIEQNPLLQNINGISNIDTLGGTSFLISNIALTSISGFNNLLRSGGIYIELNAALTSISGFSNLKTINGLTLIRNLSLQTISGFAVVDSIYGNLFLDNNHSLTAFNAFPNLKQVSNTMAFINAYVLTTINPMPLLDSVHEIRLTLDTLLPNINFLSSLNKAGSIRIVACDFLTDLNPLSGVSGLVAGDVIISGKRLSSISGLSGITYVRERLIISSNPSLTSIHGLQNITKVGLDLAIQANPLITNINKLIRLDSVGRDVYISSNPVLTNLDGLKNLRIVKGGVSVTSNLLLSSFCGLHTLYTNGGPLLGQFINQNLVNPTPPQIIAGGPCSGTLPVVLQLFNLTCEGNKVQLKWITGQEQNSSHFNIERSSDAVQWAAIGNLPAAGNSNFEKLYSFTDNAPLQNGFYRLAQYDLDSRVHYSSVLRSSSCAAKDLFATWPNPVKDKFFLSVNTVHQSKAVIRLFNNSGILIKQQESVLLPGTTQIFIDMENIPAGMYYVNVEWNEGVNKKTLKLIKQ